MPRLAVLSGPDCVGKGPLIRAVKQFYHRDIRLQEVPVLKSLESRLEGLQPTDHTKLFLPASTIRAWDGEQRYIVGECRGLPQAIDLDMVRTAVSKAAPEKDTLFINAYYTLGRQIKNNPFIHNIPDLETTSIFMSPLSMRDIERIGQSESDPAQFLTNIMMLKQKKRAVFLGKGRDAADFRSRASDAFDQLASAHLFDGVLVNHDGEGEFNWGQGEDGLFFSYPAGDPHLALERFYMFLLGGYSSLYFESWPENLFDQWIEAERREEKYSEIP